MKHRRLGESALAVSPVAIGTWELTSVWGRTADPTRGLRRALDAGINFIDTAASYGHGVAEERVGALLRRRALPRDQVVISTKAGLEQQGSQLVRDSREASIRRSLEGSLQRLQTDYVDLLLVHWPDPLVPLEETAAVLTGIVDAGLARAVGASNFSSTQMEAFRLGGRLDVAQLGYNLFRRQVEARELPFCHNNGIGVMGHSPLAQGLLGGAIGADHTFDDDDWRRADPTFHGPDHAARLAAVERLRGIARELDLSLAGLALAWIAAQPDAIVPVIGSRTPAHVDAAVHAVEVQLNPMTLRAIDRAVALVPQIDRASSVPTRIG